jgi:hypothetical protein
MKKNFFSLKFTYWFMKSGCKTKEKNLLNQQQIILNLHFGIFLFWFIQKVIVVMLQNEFMFYIENMDKCYKSGVVRQVKFQGWFINASTFKICFRA